MDTVYPVFRKSQLVDLHVLHSISLCVIMHSERRYGMICYRKSTLEDLNRIWDYQIAQNPDDSRYLRWKENFISRNVHNQAATYVTVIDGEPVGEVTLDFHAEAYGNPALRSKLADGKTTAYLTALRIRKEYEGNGHVSALIRYVEDAAREMGYQYLTIGVEAAEARNLAIYLHWGYNRFLLAEEDCGELVLFYAKQL